VDASSSCQRATRFQVWTPVAAAAKKGTYGDPFLTDSAARVYARARFDGVVRGHEHRQWSIWPATSITPFSRSWWIARGAQRDQSAGYTDSLETRTLVRLADGVADWYSLVRR